MLGLSFALPMMKPAWLIPHESVNLRYATAAIALVDASQKTNNSLRVAVEGDTFVSAYLSLLKSLSESRHISKCFFPFLWEVGSPSYHSGY